MSGWLPKSPKARRRLYLVAAIAPVLALAVGLTLWGLSDSISFFYTPAQAAEAKPPVGRSIQLGGLVQPGSVVKHPDGRVGLSNDVATSRGGGRALSGEGLSKERSIVRPGCHAAASEAAGDADRADSVEIAAGCSVSRGDSPWTHPVQPLSCASC